MKRYGVIADDLTGATDVAAAFAREGFTTAVALAPEWLSSRNAQIIAVSTDSRHDAPARARQKVRRAFVQVREAGLTVLYKKMDSTVQGNIVAEVSVLREAGDFATALICPANPGQGRTIRKGLLQIRGARSVNLRKHFQAQGLGDADWITSPVTSAKVARSLRQGHSTIISDALTQRDLRCLARAAWRSTGRVLLAGSAALAMEVARRLATECGVAVRPGRNRRRASALSNRASPANRFAGKTRGPIPGTLLLTGTTNPVTERQISVLRQSTHTPPFDLNREIKNATSAALARQGYVVIRVPVHRSPDGAIHRHLRRLAPLFHEGRVGQLLLTGGDTALLVCRWLRPKAIVIESEISPGLAWGRFVGGLADELAVCTKPGGFGSERSLARAVQFLSKLSVARRCSKVSSNDGWAQRGGAAKEKD